MEEIVDDSDMIQVQELVESNEDPFNMDFGNVDTGRNMGLELPSMDLGLNF